MRPQSGKLPVTKRPHRAEPGAGVMVRAMLGVPGTQ